MSASDVKDPAHMNVQNLWHVPRSHGVSVVIPAYKSVARIRRLMRSLWEQSLPVELFEVIIVVNGEDDGTYDLLEGQQEKNSALDLRVIRSDRASAGDARNIGIAAARKAYVTFVDDDDYIEPDFLQLLLSSAVPQGLVVTTLKDVDESGAALPPSRLVQNLERFVDEGVSYPLRDLSWVLRFNACKLIPTHIAQDYAYPTDLSSGEDIVYMAHLLQRDLVVVPVARRDSAAYVRVKRAGSLSRPEKSREFMVDQRLEVMRATIKATSLGPGSLLEGTSPLLRGQASFIRSFLESYPEKFAEVADAIEEVCPLHFPWEVINQNRARDLAILYCFPPFQDPSAVVGAKVLRTRERVVDVISANMTTRRENDPTLAALASRWIDRHDIIDTPVKFADWDAVSDFASKAFERASALQQLKGQYQTMYSRALWLGGHVAAALVKNHESQIFWTAEFSDPLARGIDAKPRAGALTDNTVTRKLRRAVQHAGIELADDLTLFEFVEQVTMVLADELIFTNTNQRDFMVGNAPDAIAALVARKTVVRPHPSPPSMAYRIVESDYEMPQDVANIGYFGRFYGSRTMESVFAAMGQLSDAVRERVVLHVFCDEPDKVQRDVQESAQAAQVRVAGHVPYLKFLSLSAQFDALIVQDAQTAGAFTVNPFLPSKLSDYRGSGARIWGIVEPGSPLAGQELDYLSRVGDIDSIRDALGAIASEVRRVA